MLKGLAHMIRNSLIRLLLVLAGLMAVLSTPAYAVVELNINKGNVQPMPIAITDLLSNDGLGAQISGVIAADLQRSGLFAPVNKQAFIEKISNPDSTPRFPDWTAINAQALVTGRVTQDGVAFVPSSACGTPLATAR